MQFRKIDISKLCNHRLFYESVPEINTEFGLDNICGLYGNLRWKKDEEIDGTDFSFCFGNVDNIQCDGQKVPISDQVDVLHILGFAYWGDTREVFVAKYMDGSEELLYVPFIDWSHPFGGIVNEIQFADAHVNTAKRTWAFGALEHPFYIHHIRIELKGTCNIEKLVLPRNMFIHIFAITLEKK